MAEPLFPATDALTRRSSRDGAIEKAVAALDALNRPDTPELRVTAVRRIDPIAAEYAPMPEGVDARLTRALEDYYASPIGVDGKVLNDFVWVKTNLGAGPFRRIFSGGGGSWDYAARPDGTDWTQTSTVEFKNALLGRLLAPMVRWNMRRSSLRAMHRARDLMEAASPKA